MSNDNQSLRVTLRSDADGHWVEWSKGGDTGSLGPYQDREMAEHVKAAKEQELSDNAGHIDDA